MAGAGAHDVDALYAHDQALSDPQRGAAEKRASMQSLLNAVKSESAPGNYTCLAFQLLANHAGSHPDQMVGVTPRLVKVCESDAANRMVRVQAARSLATIYKALKGDRQVKLRGGITKVVEGTTDSLLVRELLPCLDGLAVTPGSKVGVATTETKAAATAKATATATAPVAVTAAPPAKPTPSPAAPSPVPPPTAKAVSPLVKPLPAQADKPKVEPKPASASEPQTQVQSPQAVPAGNRLVTPSPAVTTAEELPAYLKTLPPGVVGRLTQCLGGSLNLPRNGMFFDQLAKAAGCDEVPIATLARVAKPQFSGRRLFKAELREMHAVLVRALGEGSAEGQGAMQGQVQAHEAPKEALKEVPKEVPKQALKDVEQENRKQARKEALKPAVSAPSEVGNGTSDVAIVTDRPAAVSKQEPAKQEEGRPAVALSIDSPSPYLVIRELPSHVSASMVMTLLERAGVQTLDLAYLSLARDGDSAMAMLHFRDVARAALVKERLDGRPFSEQKQRNKRKRALRLAFTVGPPTRTVCLMHLYGLHGEAVRQLINNRAKGLERLDINRGRPGDGMECAEATFATPTQAAYLVRSLTTQPHHVMGPRGRPIVATFTNPLPAFPPATAMDHSPRNGQETAKPRARSLSPPPRQAKEVKGQTERRREASPPRRSRSRDRGGDSNGVDRKRELDRSEGQSDRRDNDRKRRDGRGRSPPRPLPSPSPAPIRRRRRGEDTDDEQDEEDARLARQDDDRMDTVEEEEERASVANDAASDVASEVRSTSSPRRDDASPRRPHSPSSEARDTQEPSQSDDRSRSPSPARSEGGFRSLGGDSSDDEDARSMGPQDDEEDKKSDGGFRSLGGDSSSDEEDAQRPVDREVRDGANGSSHRRDPSPLPGGRRFTDRSERRASPPRRPIGRSRSRERLTTDRRPTSHRQPLPSTTDKARAPRRSPPRPRVPLTEPNRPIDPPRDDRPKSPLRPPSSTVGRGEWPPRRLQPSMGSRSPPTADRDRKPFSQDPPPSVAHAMRRGGPDDKRGDDRAPRRSPPRPLPSSAPAGARGGKGTPIERDMRGSGGPAPLSDRGFRPMDPGPFPGRSKRSRSPPAPMMEDRSRDGPLLKRRGGFADGPRHAPEAGHYGPPMGMQMQKPGPPLMGRGTGTLDTAPPPAIRGRGDFQGPYGPSDGPRNMPHQHGSGPGGDFVNHYGPASHTSNRGGHGRGRSPPRSRRPRT